MGHKAIGPGLEGKLGSQLPQRIKVGFDLTHLEWFPIIQMGLFFICRGSDRGK